MAVFDIVHYGDPILRKKCGSFTDFSRIEKLKVDLFDSMYEAEGIGLAANQIGLDLNLFIVDISNLEDGDEPHVFINSEIVKKHGEKGIYQEGCLSLPGIPLDILRPEKVVLKYQSEDEEWHEEEFDGLLGRAIQHEMDHLKGVFIVDRVSEVERIQYNTELKELEKNSKKRLKSQSNKMGFVL